MKPLEIPQLADDVFDRLKRLADQNGRDIVQEALECLERGLQEREEVQNNLHRLKKLRESMPNAWLTDDLIREAIDEGRP